MEVFRTAILQPSPPETFALQTVQQVIKPQKGTKLVQDENQLLENILRTLLQELVEVFRTAILQPGPPETFALQTVQQVIKPHVLNLRLSSSALLLITVP